MTTDTPDRFPPSSLLDVPPVVPQTSSSVTAPPFPPHIRSFVHRRGHITQNQRDALQKLIGHWSIPYAAHPLNVAVTFGRQAPTILEIGFGMGEATAKIALARPHENFLGIEVFNAGVGALLRRIEAAQISNLRIIQHDAVEVVRDMIAPSTLAGVHIYFPDPWPKKRHHKRRLVQGPFIALLASAALRQAAIFTARPIGSPTLSKCCRYCMLNPCLPIRLPATPPAPTFAPLPNSKAVAYG